MPAGCAKLVRATLSHRLTQLMPFNQDEAVRADNETVKGKYNWLIADPKPELILKAWGVECSYKHEITFRVNILPKAVASFLPIYQLLVKIAEKVFGVKA